MLTGIVLGLMPGLPRFELDPSLVFTLFLPPLLYAAAGSTSWPDFKAARRPIGLLALGCVLFTTLLVALATHWLLPGFDWPSSFLLGAIVSPPMPWRRHPSRRGWGCRAASRPLSRAKAW
ncbi:cation:proton antiporter [Hymenobacter sp. BRD128]|nr:cation:proton antiporter [Hymenobacter sp. BRD128]QKG55186.1 cation:proton antiporter [Hymenobacter sp. BRD128]